jgi:hypothetical protein
MISLSRAKHLIYFFEQAYRIHTLVVDVDGFRRVGVLCSKPFKLRNSPPQEVYFAVNGSDVS